VAFFLSFFVKRCPILIVLCTKPDNPPQYASNRNYTSLLATVIEIKKGENAEKEESAKRVHVQKQPLRLQAYK